MPVYICWDHNNNAAEGKQVTFQVIPNEERNPWGLDQLERCSSQKKFAFLQRLQGFLISLRCIRNDGRCGRCIRNDVK